MPVLGAFSGGAEQFKLLRHTNWQFFWIFDIFYWKNSKDRLII
jgi:hypothetical protein